MNEAPARRTCLIIEDDHDVGQLIESILVDEGFRTRLHVSGSAALQELETLQPDLITLDVGLPDIDGRSLATLLHQLTPAPILMITAHVQAVHDAESANFGGSGSSGISAFLMKPFRPTQLRNLVHLLCP